MAGARPRTCARPRRRALYVSTRRPPQWSFPSAVALEVKSQAAATASALAAEEARLESERAAQLREV